MHAQFCEIDKASQRVRQRPREHVRVYDPGNAAQRRGVRLARFVIGV
jgi:hypothetical protein